MAKAKRIFQLAKELGVDSKAIVAKCEAEGVPDITNHMSVVKIGLELSIREWFSPEEDVTTVETSDKVDIEKARKMRRKRSRAATPDESAGDDTGGDSDSTAATAVEEPPVIDETASPAKRRAAARRALAAAEAGDVKEAAAAVASPAKARTKARTRPTPQEEAPAAAEEAAAEAPAAPAAAPAAPETPATTTPEAAPAAPAAGAPRTPPAKPAIAAEAPTAPAEPEAPKPAVAMGRPNVPQRPKIVKPVGVVMNKPKSVSLKGPQVVRIEKADQLAPPRPRRGQDGGGPGGGMADGQVPGISRSRGPVRGRGAGAPALPDGDGDKPRTKRRSVSTRRGRSGDAENIGRTKFTEADMAELEARTNRASGFIKRRKNDLGKRGVGQAAQALVVTGGKVEIAEPIFIKDLSSATGIKSADVIKYLFTKKGVMATINSAIDAEAAMEVALEYNIELDVKAQQTAAEMIEKEFKDRPEVDVRHRPPVAAVLGHVDHGKTSLLDKIRSADVAAHEAGGITQHIGAYRVTIKGHDGNDKTVVFLDTPGHEAFTSMRARGASVTDLVVLVVAADDGVMPQTIESINHAKAAGVPIIVALNKIDSPRATEDNIRKIYGQLAEHGLNPTEWGGETEVLKTSALQGTGVTELLEVLDYQSELLDLKADYGGAARGVVIEAEMQEGRGPVARVLVEDGAIHVGDFIVAGRGFGRVRDMTNDRGQQVREAGPATPLEISGIDMVPDAGDHFYITQTLQKAEEVAKHYREIEREQQLASQTKVTLDNFADAVRAGHAKELRVVLKADVQGSIDVLRKSLSELGNNEVSVRVLHAAVGGVTESDVLLADASDAIVIGFHVVATTAVREIAEQRHVEIRLYRIIYELIDEVTKALEGMLEPETKEEMVGSADVLQAFRVSKLGMIAGCMVQEGFMRVGAKCRIIRDGAVVTDNRTIDNIRRVKNDVKEVRSGTECGVRVSNFDDIKEGDKIIAYNVLKIARKLE